MVGKHGWPRHPSCTPLLEFRGIIGYNQLGWFKSLETLEWFKHVAAFLNIDERQYPLPYSTSKEKQSPVFSSYIYHYLNILIYKIS